MTVTGISLFHIADGKIQEITVNMDRLGQMNSCARTNSGHR